MSQSIKSFTLGFLIAGVLFCFIPAVASVAKVEKHISNFVGSFKCRLVEVQDIDLWNGELLVKSAQLGLSFAVTAKGSATYEICPVGVGVKNLADIKGKKK